MLLSYSAPLPQPVAASIPIAVVQALTPTSTPMPSVSSTTTATIAPTYTVTPTSVPTPTFTPSPSPSAAPRPTITVSGFTSDQSTIIYESIAILHTCDPEHYALVTESVVGIVPSHDQNGHPGIVRWLPTELPVGMFSFRSGIRDFIVAALLAHEAAHLAEPFDLVYPEKTGKSAGRKLNQGDLVFVPLPE